MADDVRARVPQLAYTSNQGDIFTCTATQKQARQLTWGWQEHGRVEANRPEARLTYVWPAWAPDASRVACFGLQGSAQSSLQSSLYTVAADGIESWELAGLSQGMPIYGNWSPQGDRFAALIQRGDTLSLETVLLDRPGQISPVLRGGPLFWSWSPRGDCLAVHVGGNQRDSTAARVVVLDATSGQTVRTISTSPGDFRVPAWSPREDLLAYVEQEGEGNNKLFLIDTKTGEKGLVTTTSGTTAVLWSADGRFLAFGCTPRPHSVVFSQISVLDLTTGQILPVLTEPVLDTLIGAVTGFFWSPLGDALFTLSVDPQRSHLRWHRVLRTNGETTELVRFLPSREQMFIFSFFDQYAGSHPPIALDGSALAFAGHLIEESQPEGSLSRIYLVPLDRPAQPNLVASGHFVCWNPA